ncbi:hypothetical protein M408DRAFT_328393 [Serendipita vermifera MAFF 305830]|uniref:hydroxymethylglutaryl-CoA lyase n=1 Tax=Serendipita vermifera MAFF 305830 TaxID=933852 RepID=A0A0C3AZI4_SERVB|nr:hypothetical protein M408DRAFT_328393 [Serendipita vermifera MAFF 305830]
MSTCLRYSKIISSRACTRSHISNQLVPSTIRPPFPRQRAYATYFPGESATSNPLFVKIVECGARDGLQNEPSIVDVETKVQLIERLGDAGLSSIESGAMVSKKGVPQMATTPEVLTSMKQRRGVSYPVLVPNVRGLENLLQIQGSSSGPIVDEIAIFTAASDSFNKANTNKTVQESLVELEKVVKLAKDKGLRVRGYVSTVITCPFEGAIEPRKVREVGNALLDMGCYEVSLGDTVGTGTEKTVKALMEEVVRSMPIGKLAVSYNHDTFGMAVANVMTALQYGVRTVDSSVAGLGGCPFSPGATGNAATEDLVHALHGAGYETGVDIRKLVGTGVWISEKLNRRNESRAGRGLSARWKREEGKA